MTEVPPRRPQGAPCWVSLSVHSLPAARGFYGALFGWEFRPGPGDFGPYVRAVLDGRPVAGIGERVRGGRALPIAWTTFLCSHDADATAESIRGCGGTVGVGPLGADGRAGRMAIASDPSGAAFGVWQPAGHPGAEVVGEPGSLAWNELITRETAAVAAFYSAVFGFQAEADGQAGADRVVLRLGGEPVAGIRGLGRSLPRDRGPHWMAYFAVADPEAAARRVAELGGRVLSAPRDGGRGRQAVVADPQGAVFTLVEP